MSWGGETYFPLSALAKTPLQGIAKTAEGGSRDAEVRSPRCGVGVCIGPSAAHSSTEPHTESPKWAGKGLPGSRHTWSPISCPDGHSPVVRTPFQNIGGVPRQRPQLVRPQWPAVLAVPAPPRALALTFQVRKCPPCPALQSPPRSQMQFTGILFGQCRTLI